MPRTDQIYRHLINDDDVDLRFGLLIAFESRKNCVNSFPNIFGNICLPEPNYSPTLLFKHLTLFPIPCPVISDLGNPVFGVCPMLQLFLEVIPIPAVPEIPVNEDNDAFL